MESQQLGETHYVDRDTLADGEPVPDQGLPFSLGNFLVLEDEETLDLLLPQMEYFFLGKIVLVAFPQIHFLDLLPHPDQALMAF